MKNDLFCFEQLVGKSVLFAITKNTMSPPPPPLKKNAKGNSFSEHLDHGI